MEELLKNMDWELFEKQKEWLAEQVAVLEPSGSEASGIPEGILNMMDRIQEAWENRGTPTITVNTPIGKIEARQIPDNEFPGILLCYAEEGCGEPGAIMEYDTIINRIIMRVYSKEDPDGDPESVYEMND